MLRKKFFVPAAVQMTASLPFIGDRYKFGLRTVVCCNCGLIFTNPRPDKEWFGDFYRHHYPHFFFNVTIPDETFLNRDWIRGRHQRNVEMLSSYIPEKGCLLDIGAAEGTFLHFFQKKHPHWEVQGIEPSINFANFAKSYYQLQGIHSGDL